MAANLIAKKLRVRIGPTLEDWSSAYVSFNWGYDSTSESGFKFAKGTLELLDLPSNPQSVDPNSNPTFWKPGQIVRIDGPTSIGGWAPIGVFRILEPAARPSNKVLTLSLGCYLSWTKQREFEGDESAVEIGAGTNSAEVAKRLLMAVGVPESNISLGTWPYDIGYPLTKEDESSFVEQAGKLAWANDCRYLYQDNLGIIRSDIWVRESDTPVTTITLGTNDTLFEPSPDPIQPVESVTVTGKGFQLYELPEETVDSVTVTDNASNYSSTGFGLVAISTTVINKWTETPFPKVTKAIQIVQPRTLQWIGEESASPDWQWQYLTKEYDPITKLLVKERDCLEVNVRNFVGPDTPGSGRTLKYDKVTTYEYNDKETVIKRVVRQTEPRIAVDSEVGSSRFSHTPTLLEVTTWTEEKPEEWTERIITRTAARDNQNRRSGNVNPIALVAQMPQINPNSQPPKTERWETKWSLKEQHFSATVEWEYPGGETGLNRKRAYVVDPGFSNEQCFNIATKEVELLEARAFGYLIQSQITDGLYWVKPLSTIQVNDGSNLWTFKLDSVSWEYGGELSYIGGMGLLVDRQPLETPGPVAYLPVYPAASRGLVPDQIAPPEPEIFSPPPSNPSAILDYNGNPITGPSGEVIWDYAGIEPGEPEEPEELP